MEHCFRDKVFHRKGTSMTTPIIVVGHKNPDNDAICSAIAYAYLKNQVAMRDAVEGEEPQTYVPARLGQLPPETAHVLAKYGVEEPLVINNLFARVRDVMTVNPICIGHNATLMEAGRVMRHHNVRALVVTNDDGTYCGLVSTRMIAERYVSATDVLDEGASPMAVASNLIASLDQTVSEILEAEVLQLNADDKLSDAVEDLMASSLREAVILDDAGKPAGIVTRSDVAVRPHRKVILVDHNEIRQAAGGIEEAEVVEIIDHHRIADVATVNPIKFLNLPVGSSATIVAMEFQREGIEPPVAIAAVLLSAIMTDTVILKSPTTTLFDEQMAAYLAGIVGCDVVQFGMEVFKCRGGDDDMPIDKLVAADAKEFAVGEGVVLIAQHETVNLEAIKAREQEMRAYMRELIERNGYACVLLMVTDIIAEGSQFYCEGNRRLVNRAFGIECTGEGGTWMPGVLSRKKQVAARILEA